MFRKRAVSVQALDRLDEIEHWIRQTYALDPRDIVLVNEDRTRLPGYPESETRAVFWKGDDRYQLRVFKPVHEVVEADLPPAFLLSTLRDDGDFDCC